MESGNYSDSLFHYRGNDKIMSEKPENGPAMSEPGMIVDHAIHGRGRTKNSDTKVVGKVLVYFESGLKFACLPTNLIFVGFVD